MDGLIKGNQSSGCISYMCVWLCTVFSWNLAAVQSAPLSLIVSWQRRRFDWGGLSRESTCLGRTPGWWRRAWFRFSGVNYSEDLQWWSDFFKNASADDKEGVWLIRLQKMLLRKENVSSVGQKLTSDKTCMSNEVMLYSLNGNMRFLQIKYCELT